MVITKMEINLPNKIPQSEKVIYNITFMIPKQYTKNTTEKEGISRTNIKYEMLQNNFFFFTAIHSDQKMK